MRRPSGRRLRERLRRALGARASALDAVASAAEAHRAEALLVGGPVRDLLLRVPIGDLDVVVTDALDSIVRDVTLELGGRSVLHPSFGTAHIEAGARSLDLARARSEVYPRPGALPVVEPSPLDADFRRRDFSIHAMALTLTGGADASLLDPLGGLADLEQRQLRALHPNSFRDDPTRLWRATRYAARLDFGLEPKTRRWFRQAVADGALETISGARIRAEFDRALLEGNPARALARTARAGLLEAVSAGWELGARARAGLRRLAGEVFDDPRRRRACGLRLALLDAKPRARSAALERLSISGRGGERVLSDLAALPRLAARLSRGPGRGARDALLSAESGTLLDLLGCAGCAASRRQLASWLRHDRGRPAPLDGHAAKRFGASGPEVGRLLRAARRRALDGGTVDAAWAARWLARDRRVR